MPGCLAPGTYYEISTRPRLRRLSDIIPRVVASRSTRDASTVCNDGGLSLSAAAGWRGLRWQLAAGFDRQDPVHESMDRQINQGITRLNSLEESRVSGATRLDLLDSIISSYLSISAVHTAADGSGSCG